jgi:dTDP-4-amino-4,6-dideoxygalactose transaminase
MKAFDVVEQFEQRVAEFAGAKYGVATMTGTAAIFLCLKYCRPEEVIMPARTFISVPMAVRHAGAIPHFIDYEWHGTYRLEPTPIIDGALRWYRGMYKGGLHCLSFHARKRLPIGEGGMVLTNDPAAADWLRAARYSGRKWPAFAVEDVTMEGWQAYMTPEKAARGLHLMEYTQDYPDQIVEYPDLREVPLFKGAK